MTENEVIFAGDDDEVIKHQPSSSVMRQKTYVGNNNSNGNIGHEYSESLADAFQNNGDINGYNNDNNNGFNINDDDIDDDDDMDQMDQLTKNESQSNVHSLLDYDENSAKIRKAVKQAPNFAKTQSVEPAKLQSNIKRQNSKKKKSLNKVIEINNNNLDEPNVIDAFGNQILTENNELETFTKPIISNNSQDYKMAKFSLPLEQVTSSGTVITHNNDDNDDIDGYGSFDENEQLLTNDGNNTTNMSLINTNEIKDESKDNVNIKPLESSKRRRNSKKFPKTPKNQINGFGTKSPNFNTNVHQPPQQPLTEEQKFLKSKKNNPCSMMPCFNFLNT